MGEGKEIGGGIDTGRHKISSPGGRAEPRKINSPESGALGLCIGFHHSLAI